MSVQLANTSSQVRRFSHPGLAFQLHVFGPSNLSMCFQYHDGIQILHPPSSSTRSTCVLSSNLSHSKVGFSLCLGVISTRRNFLLSRVFADMLSDDVVHRSLNHDHIVRSSTECFVLSHPKFHSVTPCTKISVVASRLCARTCTGPFAPRSVFSYLDSTPPNRQRSRLTFSFAVPHHHELCLLHAGVPRRQRESLALHKSTASSPVSSSAQVSF